MGSPWTDESAILRDLSFAQGRWVPAGIDAAVAGEKPPAYNIREETEEEYFQHWTTDGDFSTGPDLIRIKKMLELMQGEEPPDEEVASGPIEITKLNPINNRKLDPKISGFVPVIKGNCKENKNPITNKPRRARNVAIASIMALANPMSEDPVKLCKPEDFMKQNDDEIMASERRKDSVNKVTNWLQSQDIPCMFRKKSSINSLKENGQKDLITGVKKSPVRSEGSVKSPQNGHYVPSRWAEEYYKKAMDRSLVRDLVKEDVWGRAERVMKEIDVQKAEELRKQQEAAVLAAELAAAAAETMKAENKEINEDIPKKEDSKDEEGIAHMLLSKHRHELFAGNCVVCEVLTVQPNQSIKPSLIETPPEYEATENAVFETPKVELVYETPKDLLVYETPKESLLIEPLKDKLYKLKHTLYEPARDLPLSEPSLDAPLYETPKDALMVEQLNSVCETRKDPSLCETVKDSPVEPLYEPPKDKLYKPTKRLPLYEQLLKSFDDEEMCKEPYVEKLNEPEMCSQEPYVEKLKEPEKCSQEPYGEKLNEPEKCSQGSEGYFCLMRTAYVENLNVFDANLRPAHSPESGSFEEIEV